VKLVISLLFLVPNAVHLALPVLPKADLALELAPALMGVGFILGYRQSGVLVSGSLASAVVLTPIIAWIGAGLVAPLAPETTKLVADMTANEIWARYVRYIGAGAVAVAGIVTVLKGLPTMASAFVAVAKGVRRATGAACSASCSSRSRRASWASWACRRSRRRGSRSSRSSAWRRYSRLRAGPIPARARRS